MLLHMWIGMEKIKLLLFSDDKINYIEKLQEPKNISKVSDSESYI